MASPTMLKHALPGSDDILRVELENGIIVLARENFSSPAVVISGHLRGGDLQVPREQAGLANFHSAMLTRGTRRYSFGDLFEEIESIGASLNVSSGGHTSSFDTKSLAEDVPHMLNLLSEVLRYPAFPEEHVERVRGQIITGLQMREHNTRAMAALRFQEIAYEGHPYGISSSGYMDTITAITRDDLLAFHKNLGPRGAIVAVVGAVKAEQAVEMVREAFGDWENPEQPPPPLAPDHQPVDGIRQVHAVIPGKTQSDLILGTVGPRRSAPDFQAARMANSVLGVFGMYGRLGDNVRQKQGLAYYCYSSMSGGLGPGPWRVVAGVAPDKVDVAVGSIRDEIRRICEEPVTEDELSENKSFFKGQLLLGLEMNEGVADGLLNIELHNLGLDYLRHYSEQIDALTVDQVQQAASHYLNADRFVLAVAGPPTQGAS